jgi:hypothetical protein
MERSRDAGTARAAISTLLINTWLHSTGTLLEIKFALLKATVPTKQEQTLPESNLSALQILRFKI